MGTITLELKGGAGFGGGGGRGPSGPTDIGRAVKGIPESFGKVLMSLGMVGGIASLATFVLNIEPIMKIFGAVLQILTVAFLPIAMLFFRASLPILMEMLRASLDLNQMLTTLFGAPEVTAPEVTAAAPETAAEFVEAAAGGTALMNEAMKEGQKEVEAFNKNLNLSSTGIDQSTTKITSSFGDVYNEISGASGLVTAFASATDAIKTFKESLVLRQLKQNITVPTTEGTTGGGGGGLIGAFFSFIGLGG